MPLFLTCIAMCSVTLAVPYRMIGHATFVTFFLLHPLFAAVFSKISNQASDACLDLDLFNAYGLSSLLVKIKSLVIADGAAVRVD